MTIDLVARFAPLGERYDAFIIDVWGVVMDGARPYPGARDCLARLRALDKPVILLSNAPRRAQRVAERLAEIGIERDLYRHILSSGEASRRALEACDRPGFAALGRRYFYIGPDRDKGLLDGLDYRRVDRPAEADFVLATGIVDDADCVARYEPWLEAARAAGLPMICANPDRVVVRQSGQRVICAGAVAARYETLGGKVRYFGKPHAEIYRACLTRIDGVEPAQALAVGDNPRTDIAGAKAFGLPTALILGGVLAEELGIAWGESAPPDRIERACAAAGAVPDIALPAFVW